MDEVEGLHLDALLDRAGEGFGALRAALRREEEVLLESMQAAVAILRGEASWRASGLAEAHQAVVERIDEVSADPSSRPQLDDEAERGILVQLESHRRLATRQLAVERWLDECHEADMGRP